MKEYNKLVLYNGTYDNFTPQLDLIYNFDKFETSGKCGNNCFYFKNNTLNERHKTDNLVYINYVNLLTEKDHVLDILKNNGILDIKYSSVVIEQGFPRDSIQSVLSIFNLVDDYSLFITPYKFSDQLLMALDKIRGMIGETYEIN